MYCAAMLTEMERMLFNRWWGSAGLRGFVVGRQSSTRFHRLSRCWDFFIHLQAEGLGPVHELIGGTAPLSHGHWILNKGVWIKFNFNFCWGCELKTWFLSNRITARPQDFIFQSWRTSGLEKRAIVNVGIGKRKLSDRSRYPDFLPVPYINEEKNKWEPKTRMPKWNDFA